MSIRTFNGEMLVFFQRELKRKENKNYIEKIV
jgi:hypothetical protein